MCRRSTSKSLTRRSRAMSDVGDTARVNGGRWVDHHGRQGVVVAVRFDGSRENQRQVCVEFDVLPRDRKGDVLWHDVTDVSRRP